MFIANKGTSKKQLDELTYNIVGAAIEVHKELGPGLLENIYQKCLAKEFSLRQIKFVEELRIPLAYKGLQLQSELRSDFVVEDIIVVELKVADCLAPIHDAQLLTYMKLLKKPKGILINFNCSNIFKEGQKTLVNELYRLIPDA
ncbi:MAG: GxxExxY protein [Chitinophagales bacterium]